MSAIGYPQSEIFVSVKKIFEAIVPGWKGVPFPKEFPWHVRISLRASVLVAHFFSLRYYALPFGMINPDKRMQVIHKLYHHRVGAIRNIVQFWKITAFMTQC